MGNEKIIKEFNEIRKVREFYGDLAIKIRDVQEQLENNKDICKIDEGTLLFLESMFANAVTNFIKVDNEFNNLYEENKDIFKVDFKNLMK